MPRLHKRMKEKAAGSFGDAPGVVERGLAAARALPKL